METKPAILSKTLWINAIIAVLAIFAPMASEFVKAHINEALIAVPIINIALRLITKGKIELW